MCNLYNNETTTRDAVLQFTKAFRDRAGWNEPPSMFIQAIRRRLSALPRTDSARLPGRPGECHRRQPI
jgi:hypothetical protein